MLPALRFAILFENHLARVRVRLLVDLLQAGRRQMRVNLCGGKVFVSEKFLDAAQFRARIQHMRGERMAKRVG